MDGLNDQYKDGWILATKTWEVAADHQEINDQFSRIIPRCRAAYPICTPSSRAIDTAIKAIYRFIMQRFLASFLLAASAVLGRPASLEITDAGDTTTTNGCPTCASAFTEWTITDLEYHASYIFSTPAHQNSWGYVSFNVTNPAVPYVVPCTAASSQLSDFFYGTMIYECPVPAGSGGALTFTYNRPTGELALNQTWICRDDPQYP